MKKIGKFLKGVLKGVRDASPIPSKEAEEKTGSMKMIDYATIYELAGQKLGSRGIAIIAFVWAVNEIFNLGLF